MSDFRYEHGGVKSSGFAFQISHCVRRPYFSSQLKDCIFRIAGICTEHCIFRISYLRLQILNFRFEVMDFGFRISEFRFQDADSRMGGTAAPSHGGTGGSELQPPPFRLLYKNPLLIPKGIPS